ncbi:hypothetical protein B296_00004649 [Ensete ventricosum]|uniref:Uncharacterized protein n=1 Tax=Ensete ventricosum TaxID=4639 RepID=A0A427B7G0_ENSVE|nr:hypothetical protein B296_00004649 [Ensete ventricosum]
MRLWNHKGKQRDEEGKDSGGSNSRGTEISGRERRGCRRRPRAPAVVAIVGVWPIGSGYGMGERGGGNMQQVVGRRGRKGDSGDHVGVYGRGLQAAKEAIVRRRLQYWVVAAVVGDGREEGRNRGGRGGSIEMRRGGAEDDDDNDGKGDGEDDER